MSLDPAIDSRDTTLLDPDFAAKLDQLIYNCADREAEFVVYFTIRGPVVQAKLWCQSRPVSEIAAKRAEMIAGGASKLAALLLDSYAATGRRVTNAAPGDSWHQYGTAADCFLCLNGIAVWSSPLYTEVYADEAVNLGLTAGANWAGAARDMDHVQASPLGSPLDEPGATWATVEARMVELYGI